MSRNLRVDSNLSLEISNDGAGLPAKYWVGVGLRTMQERAVGKGTRLCFSWQPIEIALNGAVQRKICLLLYRTLYCVIQLPLLNGLSAADFAIGPTREVAILGDLDNPETHELLKALWKSYRPRQVTAISAYPPGPGSPALLKDGPLLNSQPTAYVCQGCVCLQPVNSPYEMQTQLPGSLIK